jgi:hypothetical protein
LETFFILAMSLNTAHAHTWLEGLAVKADVEVAADVGAAAVVVAGVAEAVGVEGTL